MGTTTGTTVKTKVGYFTDNMGNKSMIRLLSAITCAMGWLYPILAILKGALNTNVVAISLGFVGAGLGIKELSKRTEAKIEVIK